MKENLMIMKKLYTSSFLGLMFLFFVSARLGAQNKSDFEDLMLDPDSYWNGITATYGNYSSTMKDSVYEFNNSFTRADYGFGMYESWNGFAYSRMQDDTTAGFDNQYSAITASGAFGSENYGLFSLAYGSDTIHLTKAMLLDSVFVTNGTYPFLSMRDGDMFAKKFGGETGNDPDWFMLSLIGLNDGVITDTIEFYLADYRFEDNANDYIVSEWEKIDLSVLGAVDQIALSLSSSDIGDYGMNTPAFFFLDNLSGTDFENFSYISGDYWNGNTALFGNYNSSFENGSITFPNSYSVNDYGFGVMESWSGFAYSDMMDASTPGFSNQYSAAAGSGVGGSFNYALCNNIYGKDTITLNEADKLTGMFVTNGTYGYQSMLNGDMFAKKFGGESGDDPDWFLLTVRGLRNGTCTDTVEFYLADFRSENNDEDYILNTWEWLDLSVLDTIDQLEFSLSSSDMGDYGMNTPAYFFMDEINDQLLEQVSMIPDTSVYNTETEVVMDLTGVFADPDAVDPIDMIIESATNEDIFSSALFSGNFLTIALTQNTGTTDLVVKATSGGHSLTDTFSLTVEENVAIELSQAGTIEVYPNPTEGLLRIENVEQENCQVKIYDLYGRCLHSQLIESAGVEVDITDFNAGMYMVKIQLDNEVITHTIRKQ